MRSKIAGIVVIIAIALVGFLAIYFKKPPSAEKSLISPESGWKATFKVAVENISPIKIGIIGESQGGQEKGEAFNSTIVKQLFKVLNDHQVLAVFFTGNLVSGFEKDSAKKENQGLKGEPVSVLKRQLGEFLKVYEGAFGQKVPLFPISGQQELIASNSSKIFLELFGLEKSKLFDEKTFGYTVEIGPAFFVVIPTDSYNEKSKAVEVSFSPEMQSWLSHQLQEGSKKHQYLFVIAHEPVFSTQSTFQDTKTDEHDAFWKILTENKVLAYFSSQERLFDRSYRHNVWQVISGGGGARKEGDQHPFYHSLLLTIPIEGQDVPKVEVLNSKGEAVDVFELINPHSPLYQRHIY